MRQWALDSRRRAQDAMQMPKDMPMPEKPSELDVAAIADQCVRETKTWKMSKHAKEMALIALATHGVGDAQRHKKVMRLAYIKEYRPGFVFTMIVLPILISLVSQWVARWILDHWDKRGEVAMMAMNTLSLGCQSEIVRATRMST